MAIVATGEMAITPDLKGFERSMTSSLGGIARKAAAAFGGAFAVQGAFKATIGAAIEFESSFAGVRKTVDATEAEFGVLAKTLRDLAKEIPVNVNELNRIAEAAGQLGVAKEAIGDFTETIALMAATTNLSADEAANAFARIANITGLPQDQFDNLGSTVVELGNKLAATESELIDFALRIAGAGELAGLTEANILAIGGAMASVGVEAEAGGTAVQKVLLSIIEAVGTGNDDLAKFAETAGQTSKQFADAFRKDAAGAFTDFVEGLGRSGDKAFVILEELGLEDQRLIRSFLSLANAGDLLSKSIGIGTDAFAKNNALTTEAQKRFETTESKLLLLKNQFKDIGITVGDAFLPAIADVVGSLSEKLPGAIETTKTKLGELEPALAPIRDYFVTTLGPALKDAAEKLLPAIESAIGRVGEALERNKPQIEELGRAITTITPYVVTLGRIFEELVINQIAGLAIGFLDLAGAVVKTWDDIVDVIRNSVNAIIRAYNALPFVGNIKPVTFGEKTTNSQTFTPSNFSGAQASKRPQVFAEGGVVQGRFGSPQWVVAHAGEEVLTSAQRGQRGGNVFHVNVTFAGALPTDAQAYTAGQAVGRGAAAEMERADARRAARVA